MLGLVIFTFPDLTGQDEQLAYLFTGVVYDANFRPLPFTHVLAHGTGVGDVTDSLGIFRIYVRKNDKLSFYNIAFQDTSKFISSTDRAFYIKLRKRYYSLGEARIYSWGSTYEEFLDEVKRQGIAESEGEKMGLPTQDPDHIPYYLDDKLIKSFKFFLASPLSSLYYNYNKREKGARRAYQLEKDKELIDKYEKIVGAENISWITGLKGEDLQEFMRYLNKHMHATYHSSELRILTEIHSIWKRYQEVLKDSPAQ